MLTWTQYQILKRFFPGTPDEAGTPDGPDEQNSKLALMGDELFTAIRGRVVIDFGCGEGTEAVEMAARGASRVFGIDMRESVLRTARQKALVAGVQDTCIFATSTDERADVIVSVDAFEHFADPAGILKIMDSLLRPAGEVFVSFGPSWYHPLGGHLFSVFPWAHLIFTERALIRWRSDFKTDGAKRFGEVAGGLNQMTIRRFEQLVSRSPFRFERLELAPIRQLRRFHNRLTREFTTAVVRCRLVKRGI
jgi:SAM-dependent methyltransferase